MLFTTIFDISTVIIIAGAHLSDPVNAADSIRPWLQTGPPRFKQNQRVVHEVFLNDKAVFKCTALARPAPKIHWFRNGDFLDHNAYANNDRLRENKKHFSLEIRRVEVSDQGSWACKVWNQAGSIFRNFTLEIIDFCDYFLMHEFPPANVPEKCICLWYLTGEYRKEGINWTEVDDVRCETYQRYALHVRKPFGKKICANDACGNELPEEHEVLQGVGLHDSSSGSSRSNSSGSMPDVLHFRTPNLYNQVGRSATATADAAAKRLRARTLLQQQQQQQQQQQVQIVSSSSSPSPVIATAATRVELVDDDDSAMDELADEDLEADENLDEPLKATSPTEQPFVHITLEPLEAANTAILSMSTTGLPNLEISNNTAGTSTTTSSSSTSTRTTTRLSFPPQKVPPYFKVRDEDAETSVITPSGRTIKLQCKAGGQPEPQVIWFNNNKKVITTEVRRPVGTEFRLRKNTLEIEDVAESDSGDYTCEASAAFNSVGSVTRTFKLRVVDRMRSKPIIVPNILVNQTVDANGTVNFTCKVISDLTPHIVWMRIEMTNDSIYYWNETDRKYVFKYTDMQTVENAMIVKTSQDSSTLTIVNVTIADQGMYACVSGNHLGHAIANATLTVNEFHAMTLATGNPDSKWSRASIAALIILIILLLLTLAVAFFYIFCIRRRSKAHIAEMEQLIGPVRKRVIVTKRPPDPEHESWSDMPSTYQIHVEPIATSGTRRPRLSNDLTFLSDYEIPPDPAWEVERSRLRFVQMLGEGAFGEVWKAVLKPATDSTASVGAQQDSREDEIDVAVKKLKASAHEKELIDLVSEMETFKIIGHHENLLRLIGCCTGTGPLYVIVELCKHGNLRDFLRAHRPRDTDAATLVQTHETTMTANGAHNSIGSGSNHYLEPRKLHGKLSISNSVQHQDQAVLIKHLTQRHLVQFAWQVAKGMEFMASRKIIHRDLAARNVLVADGFVMKISDFGLSRDVHYNDYYRKKGNGRLPIKWMALEALDSHVYTIYSDVWSFGILLWEIMTLGGTPYPSIAMQQLYSCLKEGYRMEAPDNCPDEVYDVMVACWQEKPENRPSFDTLVDYFDWMLTQSARDHENYLEVQSVVSAASDEVKDFAPPPPSVLRGGESPNVWRKVRPLSEPIIRPTEPVVDSNSDSEFETDSHPLLSATKVVVCEQQERPGVNFAFVKRYAPSLATNVITTSLLNHCDLNSTATVSIDSAIGSPVWSASAASAQMDLDANDGGQIEMCQPRRLGVVGCNDCTSDVATQQHAASGKHTQAEFGDSNMINCNGHYVNVAGTHDGAAEKERLRITSFPFLPLNHTRFSDSTTYDAESIQMENLKKPPLDVFCANRINQSSNEADGVTPASSTQQRRFSIESSSSGRGGSSGMSSAEGLGAIAEFCRIEYSQPDASQFELFSKMLKTNNMCAFDVEK